MTRPLTAAQTTRLLREALTLLDAADRERDMLAWWERKDAFLASARSARDEDPSDAFKIGCAETRRKALEEALAAVSAEDMFDDTGHASDAAYSRAIHDCRDVIRALINQLPAPTTPDLMVLALARLFKKLNAMAGTIDGAPHEAWEFMIECELRKNLRDGWSVVTILTPLGQRAIELAEKHDG